MNYWSERYRNNDTGWDAGSITTPIKEYIDQLADHDLRILIPGAGNGWEAEYLHRRGFRDVTVIDIASEPLQNLRERVPSFPAEKLLHADFFTHNGQYDLMLEQTFFCAIPPEMRAAYALQAHRLLRPGGILAGVLFEHNFNKDSPPFGGNREEYIRYFSPFFEIEIMEPCYNSIAPRAGKELFIKLSNR